MYYVGMCTVNKVTGGAKVIALEPESEVNSL